MSAGNTVHDVVELPRGRKLTVRTAVVDDLPGLRTLYDDLSSEDRYRRFFSDFRPDDEFFERLVRRSERGGACLVAEVEGPDGLGEIVAEADFEPLADGDAELAVTVARSWRGWLAPYLLDVLVRQAAAMGIPNLQAEILTLNRPMLSLLRARGYATLDQDDYSTVRATIGTTQRIPSWPGRHERPRVLVEIPGGRWRATAAVTAAGFDVIACPGPGPGRPECPMLAGRPCPLVEGADVVVFALRPGDPRSAELLASHRSDEAREGRGGRHPLVIEVRGRDAPPAELPEGAVELDRPTPEQVVQVLTSLFGDPAEHERHRDTEPVER